MLEKVYDNLKDVFNDLEKTGKVRLTETGNKSNNGRRNGTGRSAVEGKCERPECPVKRGVGKNEGARQIMYGYNLDDCAGGGHWVTCRCGQLLYQNGGRKINHVSLRLAILNFKMFLNF